MKCGTKRSLHQARLCWASTQEHADRTLTTVISGGQTGADLAALSAAQKIGFKTGGRSLKRMREYDIEEVSAASVLRHGSPLVARSIANVEQADGTVAFRTAASPGTDKTIGYCVTGKWVTVDPSRASQLETEKQHKPLLVLRNSYSQTNFLAQQIADFVYHNKIRVLNVCGHRSDERAFFAGYTQAVERIMCVALIKIKQEQHRTKKHAQPTLFFQ